MLHTKYQCSRPYGFRKENFIMFSIYKPIDAKNVTPGVGQFLNKLSMDPLECYIPNTMALGLMGSGKNIFFMFFSMKAYVKHVIRARGGGFFVPGT